MNEPVRWLWLIASKIRFSFKLSFFSAGLKKAEIGPTTFDRHGHNLSIFSVDRCDHSIGPRGGFFKQ